MEKFSAAITIEQSKSEGFIGVTITPAVKSEIDAAAFAMHNYTGGDAEAIRKNIIPDPGKGDFIIATVSNQDEPVIKWKDEVEMSKFINEKFFLEIIGQYLQKTREKLIALNRPDFFDEEWYTQINMGKVSKVLDGNYLKSEDERRRFYLGYIEYLEKNPIDFASRYDPFSMEVQSQIAMSLFIWFSRELDHWKRAIPEVDEKLFDFNLSFDNAKSVLANCKEVIPPEWEKRRSEAKQ